MPDRAARRVTSRAPKDPAAFNAALGAHIRKLRIRTGLRQVDLAGEGLVPSAIARIEGGYSGVSLKALELLAHRIGCSIRDLIPAGW